MMRALWSRSRHDHVSDALAQLDGWVREGSLIRRTLLLDDTQHAALTERIKVAADVLHVRPEVRRLDGHTQIKISPWDGTDITEREVALAARIEDVYRARLTD